jgi:hypothetical protein
MKLHVYKVETLEVVEVFEGETNDECETAAAEYLGCDEYAATYTPAFGTVDGLIDN